MTVATVTNTTTPTPTTLTSADQARTTLSSNFDTFLKLLTTQLQNQDPLSPMDSSKFTEQLVQYSQVEQQIETNSKLTDLTSTLTKQIQASSAGAALAYIGKTAMFNSDGAAMTNGAAHWDYTLAAPAAATTLTVTDANGATVYQAAGELATGTHGFDWNGKDTNGATLPDGIYHLKVSATDTSGAAVTNAVTVNEVINGVDMSGADPAVTTSAGTRAFSTILKITG
jgi:flagellar basal-body rod modification protein FlgD